MLSTSQGDSLEMPAGFCFSTAPNAVFYEFQTLDLMQFPGLNFNQPTASLSIQSINCDTDSTLGQAVNIAVFTAADACDPQSFDAPIECRTGLSSSEEIELINLEASTTYYVLVSGFTGAPPATDPSECDVSIAISGPAVTYDLQTNWYPEGDEGRQPKVLYENETAVLVANEDLDGFSWEGQFLNGCEYSDNVVVIIRPAIVPYNSFTPNDDGINEFWEIEGIRRWPNAQVVVYSRWGQKVFQATNYREDWDGDGLPAATYYYVIELNPIDSNTDPYTGSVTIIR
jgi:gliding motility-associated-like protein